MDAAEERQQSMPVRRSFSWTRRFIRRNFPQVPEPVAERWERRLSFAYFFLGWNALAGVIWVWYSGRQKRELTGDERGDKIARVRRLMSASQSESVRMIEYRGLTRVSDETVQIGEKHTLHRRLAEERGREEKREEKEN